jgi:hypothetical protein
MNAATTVGELPSAGEMLGGRFLIERAVGWGAHGAVYRAVDTSTKQPVAIKVLRSAGESMVERFTREARALRSVAHPAIVRLLASGVTREGDQYLVMEWVEGESLARALARGPLALSSALVLGVRLAGALAAVHAAGMVHRDVSPGNVVLPGGRLAEAKLVDFGIVRLLAEATTRPGAAAGTPGYMALEQVRGDAAIDARADVFGLGCVLYRAIAGAPPFDAEHEVGMSGRVLFDDVPRLSDELPAVPRALDDLLARMMAREPQDRPSGGAAVLRELGLLAAGRAPERPALRIGARGVPTLDERRLVSIVVATPPEGAARAAALERARSSAAPFGARVERLADGTIVAALSGRGGPRDWAERAARCALSMRDAMAGAPVALATGRAEQSRPGSIGGVIDRAATLLGTRHPPAPVRAARVEDGGVAIDELTAGLLGPPFELVTGAAGRLYLRGEGT